MTNRDPVFNHCIYLIVCLQMTNNFLSISSTIPWNQFRGKWFWSGTKRQLKVCKTVSVFYNVYELPYPLLTGVQHTIAVETGHMSTQSVDVSVSVCISVDLRNLPIIKPKPLPISFFWPNAPVAIIAINLAPLGESMKSYHNPFLCSAFHTQRASQSASHYYPWALGLNSFLKPSQLPGGEYTALCYINIRYWAKSLEPSLPSQVPI